MFVRFLFVLLFTLGPTPYAAKAADPLVEFLFWDKVGGSVADGVSSYQKLRAEREMWAAEANRLRSLLDECDNCLDRNEMQQQLKYWETTEADFQSISSNIFAMTGIDPVVQRFLGVTNPVRAPMSLVPRGSRGGDNIDPATLPDPDWLADSPKLCKVAYERIQACRVQLQNAPSYVANVACREPASIVKACAEGDIQGAEDQATLISLRSAGMPLPEIHDAGYTMGVDYGRVTPGATPVIPAGGDMFAYFKAAKFRKTISFQFDRFEPGYLTSARYERFNWSAFLDMRESCPIYKRLTENVDACKFVREQSSLGGKGNWEAPPMLICEYRTGKDFQLERFIFWLHERPAFLSDPRTRTVSSEIVRTKVVDFCPMKREDLGIVASGTLEFSGDPSIDYTISMETVGFSLDPTRRDTLDASGAVSRARKLLDVVETEGVDLGAEAERRYAAALAQEEERQRLAAAAAEAAKPKKSKLKQRLEQQVAAKEADVEKTPHPAQASAPVAEAGSGLDVAGISVGMTFAEADIAARLAIGDVMAVLRRDVRDDVADVVTRHSIHYADRSGSVLSLFVLGTDSTSPVYAVTYQKLERGKAGQAQAYLDDLAANYQGSDLKSDGSGLFIGNQQKTGCAATFTNFAGGHDPDSQTTWLTKPDTALDRTTFQRSLSVRVGPQSVGQFRNVSCSEHLQAAFSNVGRDLRVWIRLANLEPARLMFLEGK